jgi:hypothetical protein
MYNKKIKSALKSLIKENKTPGIDVTKKVSDESEKYNKEYQKDTEAKMKEYAKDSYESEDVTKKHENSTEEQEYHDQMEIRNGQEMIRYDREPNEQFKERAKMSMVGDSKMGNKKYEGKWNPDTGEGNGNTEDVWKFQRQPLTREMSTGEKMMDDAKKSLEKRDAQAPKVSFHGDDMEYVPENKDGKANRTPKKKNVYEGKKRLAEGLKPEAVDNLVAKVGVRTAAFKIVDMLVQRQLPIGLSDLPDSATLMNGLDEISERLEAKDYDNAYEIAKDTAMEIVDEQGMGMDEFGLYGENTNKEEIKETVKMKRLRFKNEIGGAEKAIKLIPEHYKVDNKEFEMTDGNETYHVRWEGDLNEGAGVILKATNQNMINEEMAKMKNLWGFKAQDTLGRLKAQDRMNENSKFDELMEKSKKMLK